MLTEEEKQELQELNVKDELTDDEISRKAYLNEKDTETMEDEFDAAFDEATADDDPNAVKKKDEDLDKDKDSDDADPDKKGDIFVSPDDTTDDDDDQKGDDDGEQKTELELAQEEIKKLTHKMSSWEGRITAANKRADEAEQKLQDSTQDKDAGKKADLPEGEDDEVIKDFIEEFPSLEKPIKAIAKKLAEKVIDKKLKELQPKFEKIDQVEESVQSAAETDHFKVIKDAHSDYQEIVKSGKLAAWIELQPSFLKKSLEAVASEGTAEEVVEMFDSYKRSTGVKSPSAKEKDKPSKKKADDLLAVDSTPTVIPKKGAKGIDKDDFDSAWDLAISKE